MPTRNQRWATANVLNFHANVFREILFKILENQKDTVCLFEFFFYMKQFQKFDLYKLKYVQIMIPGGHNGGFKSCIPMYEFYLFRSRVEELIGVIYRQLLS